MEGLAYPGTYATKKTFQEIAQIKDEVNRALQFADGTHRAPQPAYFAGASLFLSQEDEIPDDGNIPDFRVSREFLHGYR